MKTYRDMPSELQLLFIACSIAALSNTVKEQGLVY